MRKNSKSTKNINDEYYSKKGYKSQDLNTRTGKPKRSLASFQIEAKLWREFDKMIEERFGKYKKSYIIEGLIREYMALKKSKRIDNNNNNNNNDDQDADYDVYK